MLPPCGGKQQGGLAQTINADVHHSYVREWSEQYKCAVEIQFKDLLETLQTNVRK